MFKKIFSTGLTAIIPLVITVYVILGLFHFADGVLGKFINQYLQKYIGYEIPGLGIVIAILLIFFLGAIIHLSRMKLLKWVEHVFFRIPLFNKIYLPIRRIVDFLFFPPQKSFKNTVLIEYPRRGIYSLGFVTSYESLEFKERGRKELCNVYIPSSPYILTGFTIIVEKKDLTFLEISVEQAIRLIISGGLLTP